MTRQEPQTMRQARGFSLVELIVAMTVTLIVSSAIYGLLTSGGNAFRREPELADRQQNIRAAMDMVARDVFGAGAAMPTFAQVFSRTDPAAPGCTLGLNGCGQAGTMGAAAAAARGADSENTDVLQAVSTDEQCPHLGVCSAAPIAGATGLFVSEESVPQCLRVPGLVLLANDNAFTIQAATASALGTACPGTGVSPPNGNLTLTATLAPFTASPAITTNPDPPAGNAVYLYRARVVRYRVAPNTDPLDSSASLWRTESGAYNPDGSAALEPGAAGFDPSASPWQLVARGIEDLQLEYFDGNGAWLNQPPVSLANNWTTLVRQVRITLSARTSAPMLQGATLAGGVNAVHGQLSSVVTPRSAFHELQMCRGAATPCTAAEQIQ